MIDREDYFKPHLCPICGKFEFPTRGSYDVCEECGCSIPCPVVPTGKVWKDTGLCIRLESTDSQQPKGGHGFSKTGIFNPRIHNQLICQVQKQFLKTFR